jgi:hypothetical protein
MIYNNGDYLVYDNGRSFWLGKVESQDKQYWNIHEYYVDDEKWVDGPFQLEKDEPEQLHWIKVVSENDFKREQIKRVLLK